MINLFVSLKKLMLSAWACRSSRPTLLKAKAKLVRETCRKKQFLDIRATRFRRSAYPVSWMTAENTSALQPDGNLANTNTPENLLRTKFNSQALANVVISRAEMATLAKVRNGERALQPSVMAVVPRLER